MGTEFRIAMEMGFTEADFLRTISIFMAGKPYQVEGSRIRIAEEEREITISLSGHRERKIGPTVSFPLMDVEFVFSGFGEEERKAFMKRFELIFRRGGG